MKKKQEVLLSYLMKGELILYILHLRTCASNFLVVLTLISFIFLDLFCISFSTRNSSTEPKTSQIFYQPDSDDDFDDEDPDEDLNI